MADVKISGLPASTVPLGGTEVLPIVQSTTTKQVSVANLTAGRTFDALGMTLTSTDAGASQAPTIDLYRDSASPAASDTIGEIEFNGKDSAANKQAYALLHGSIASPTSGAEQGQIHFETATAGALTEKMIIGTSNLVVNDIGAIFNVRIEGDTDANLFYTDATNSRVGIGTISPAQKLDVAGSINLTGNVVIGTSGQGIDFTATPGAGTSELLADYEEGTWTPLISADGAGVDNFTSSTATGKYTKIGRLVNIECVYTYTAIQSATSSYAFMTGIPFAAAANMGFFYVGINGGADTATYSGLASTGTSVVFVKDQNTTGVGFMLGGDFPSATRTVTFTTSYTV
jgi:hypothetical protein